MRILVLGGGVSGLSAAWYLRKKDPRAEIILLEKGSRLGGVIQTDEIQGSLVERGPRTFVVSRSSSLLQLMEEVGLKEEILFSDPKSSKRYLWHQGSLRSMGRFLPMAFLSLVREAFVPKKEMEDESIYDFAVRRLTRKVADTLLDPMTLGIYSGDIRKLSLRSCFPFLHEWEMRNRSFLRSLFHKGGDSRLFTLRRGIGSLIEEIGKKLTVDIVLNCPVEFIAADGVNAGGKFYKADKIICALPGPVMGELTKSWLDFPANSLWVVSLGFKTKVLSKKGFGYLVPSQEKESLLGMVWDSSIFPRDGDQTILTAMIRPNGDRSWAESQALKALQRHLGCETVPNFIDAHLMKEAIPQLVVGYQKRLDSVQEDLKGRFPSMTLVGNYINGVSVDACVRSAVRAVSGL